MRIHTQTSFILFLTEELYRGNLRRTKYESQSAVQQGNYIPVRTSALGRIMKIRPMPGVPVVLDELSYFFKSREQLIGIERRKTSVFIIYSYMNIIPSEAPLPLKFVQVCSGPLASCRQRMVASSVKFIRRSLIVLFRNHHDDS